MGSSYHDELNDAPQCREARLRELEVKAKQGGGREAQQGRERVESAKASCLLGVERAADCGDGAKALAFAEAYRALCG